MSRKNVAISLQPEELALLDEIAARLNMNRSATVRILVGRYYKDIYTKKFWEEAEEEAAKYGRKVE